MTWSRGAEGSDNCRRSSSVARASRTESREARGQAERGVAVRRFIVDSNDVSTSSSQRAMDSSSPSLPVLGSLVLSEHADHRDERIALRVE